MFLLSPQQLNCLTRSEQTIRNLAEDDLDAKIRAVLNEPELNPHESVKKYDTLLQSYLNLVKQGQKEEKRVTVTLHKGLRGDPLNNDLENNDLRNIGPGNISYGVLGRESEDVTMIEVMKNLPQRNCKNAENIMKK